MVSAEDRAATLVDVSYVRHFVPPQQVEAQHATCEGRGHTKVPRGFPPKIQLLDLRSNHFHYLPANSFPGTEQVVSLHLELCKIHEIEDHAFRGMKSLFYLYLSDNDLTSLSPKAFAGAPELTYLHLEGNRLAQFPTSGQWLSPAACKSNSNRTINKGNNW